VVEDFGKHDVLDLRGLGLYDLDDVLAATVFAGGDAVITVGANTVTVSNVTSFAVDDFVF
jgi:hypothetical protein